MEIGPALAAWVAPHRDRTGKLWVGDPALSEKRNEGFFHKRLNARCAHANVPRRTNGLRHAFCSYHFALHANENLTAAQAGNSPAMIHQHYKGLATKKEAEAWFAVRPAKTAANIITLPQKGAAK